MRRYDLLYRLYSEFDTATLREYQRFVDIFPPADSRVALEYWERADNELETRKERIGRATPGGRPLAEIVARVTRDQAFTALDLHAKYGRAVDVLVLDVDETLRSAGSTDNEIPRSTLAVLQDFHDRGVPIIICTGQTLENVKGFAIQGLGSSVVHSGDLSIVYEGGTGVFTPGHGTETKRLLYEELPDDTVATFDRIRSRILRGAPERVRRECHLQGNEFNVTLKPNFETGSEPAVEIVERALVYLLDLLGEVVADAPTGSEWAHAFYAANDPEIASALSSRDARPGIDPGEIPGGTRERFDAIDLALYPGDAAEISSRALHKAAGVRAAYEVLGLTDPFAVMLGDSKSDLRVMEWLAAEDAGIAAAPEHASEQVLDHVRGTDDLVFPPGRSVDVLRTVDAMNRLDAMASVTDTPAKPQE